MILTKLGFRVKHVTRNDAERLLKISRDNIPAGRKSPGLPKRRYSDLIRD